MDFAKLSFNILASTLDTKPPDLSHIQLSASTLQLEPTKAIKFTVIPFQAASFPKFSQNLIDSVLSKLSNFPKPTLDYPSVQITTFDPNR